MGCIPTRYVVLKTKSTMQALCSSGGSCKEHRIRTDSPGVPPCLPGRTLGHWDGCLGGEAGRSSKNVGWFEQEVRGLGVFDRRRLHACYLIYIYMYTLKSKGPTLSPFGLLDGRLRLGLCVRGCGGWVGGWVGFLLHGCCVKMQGVV